MSVTKEVQRIAPLDGLRGLASLIVLILHYRFLSDKWNDTNIHTNVFWDQLILIYKFGWLAVEMFFILSGFIFFWKYGRAISEKAISLTEFAMLRLSRIYPLHFLTLFIVLILQALIYKASGTTFFYGNNDLYHLGLNLVMLHYGWFESGFSFNASSWSIALEVSLYFLFYVLCYGRRNRPLIALGMYLFFLTLDIRGPVANMPFMNSHFARVGCCFFMGGILHFVYTKLIRLGTVAKWVGTLALVQAIVILGSIHYFFMGHPGMAQITGPRMNTLIVHGALPALVIASIFQPVVAKFLSSAPMRFFGDISYSVYMLHLPLLMTLHYVSISSSTGPIDFLQKGVFWLYISLAVGLGALSYRFVERPALEMIRQWWRAQELKAASESEPCPTTEPVVQNT